MDLSLSVPELNTTNQDDALGKPEQVQTWLQNLPLININETSHQLHKALMAANRQSVKEEWRLANLELFREFVNLVTEKLEKKYADKPLPLSEEDALTAELIRHFQIEMASGYKRYINDVYSRYKPKLTGKHAASLVMPIHRAIRYLAGTLLHSYQFYALCPVNTWKEIHQLFKLADNHQLVNIEVDDSLNISIPKSTISHVYKQALLLDLCDPYHLSAGIMGKISRYLDRWASAAKLNRANPESKESCQFLIDASADKGGEVLDGANCPEGDPTNCYMLNSIELARTIHGQLTDLKNGDKPDSDGLDEDFYDHSAHQMLLRLINSWGVNPKRVFPRTPQSGKDVELTFGLKSICFYTNQSHKFITSAELMGPIRQRTRIGTLYAKTEAIEKPVEQSTGIFDETERQQHTSWNIIDESAGGLALSATDLTHIKVRVGDLAGMREGKSVWGLAIVRWVKCLSPNRMEIGIQRLAPMAKPVAIKTLAEDDSESEFMPGILVPELPALNQAESLITPRGVFKTGRIIYMDDGRMLHRIKSQELVEITGAFERFHYGKVEV